MGNKKRDVPFKKNKNMLDNYMNSIKNKTPQYDETVYAKNLINLESSDIYIEKEKVGEDIPKSKTPFYYILKMWWAKNKMETIIGAVIIPLLIAVFIWGISTSMDVRDINIKIDNIQESIRKIESNYATKVELNLQLENIKEKVNGGSWNNYSDVNRKLDEIQEILNNSQ